MTVDILMVIDQKLMNTGVRGWKEKLLKIYNICIIPKSNINCIFIYTLYILYSKYNAENNVPANEINNA